MHKCEVCGNQYKNMIEVRFQSEDQTHRFDSFECAAHKLAPSCAQCGVRILGHGMQAKDDIFCCASCARTAGKEGFVDNTTAA